MIFLLKKIFFHMLSYLFSSAMLLACFNGKICENYQRIIV